MASSLLFNWIAAYMYEGDAPLAERRAAALALDRDLLRDLLGAEELRELLDPEVLADVELELQCLTDGRRARSADELHDVLRKVGDLSAARDRPACVTTGQTPSAGRGGVAGGAARARSGRSRSRSAARSGTSPARTQPDIAMRSGARFRSVCRWRSPNRLPVRSRNSSVGTPAPTVRSSPPMSPRRFGAPPERIAGALAALEAEERLVVGEFRPDGVSREFCDVDVLRQLRRRSLAALRREVEPVEQEAFARFLPAWHNIPAEPSGYRGACRVARRAVRRRARGVDDRDRRAACADPRRSVRRCSTNCAPPASSSGSGAGAVGATRRSRPVVFRRSARRCSHRAGKRATGRRVSCTTRSATLLAERGASFWSQLRAAAPGVAGSGDPRRAVGPRLGRRGHQRFARSAAGRDRRGEGQGGGSKPTARAAWPTRDPVGSPASVRRPVRADGVWLRRCCCRPPIPPRQHTPRRCRWSSGTAWSPARRCWPKASSAGSPACTAC